jgi:hypothetical protein
MVEDVDGDVSELMSSNKVPSKVKDPKAELFGVAEMGQSLLNRHRRAAARATPTL